MPSLRELIEAATRVCSQGRSRIASDGTERHEIIGHPCGLPIAVFGDANDAAKEAGE